MSLLKKIFSVNDAGFGDVALAVFRYQAKQNLVYKQYLSLLKTNPASVNTLEQIPFLPIECFKKHEVSSSRLSPELVFESSTTGGGLPSRHAVTDAGIYHKSIMLGFEKAFGNVGNYHFLALLPSYLQRGNASLVYMVQHLINASHNEGLFCMDDYATLRQKIKQIQATGKKIFLIGVTYALMDFVKEYGSSLPADIIIMETGGMKGRRRELTRTEVHNYIKENTASKNVYSEYGMTELLSQAYMTDGERFSPAPTLRLMIRDINDPFTYLPHGQSGGINCIDLSNYYSCSFIETQDAGRLFADGSFEILGRIDNSDIRGCNLMFEGGNEL